MYRVDTTNKRLIALKETDYSSLSILERYDIQEWIEKTVEILGEDLLIIAKELPLQTGLRLDLLAIDKDGRLVVIEIKRSNIDRNIDWQAIKYASFSSNFLGDEIFRIYSEYLNVSAIEASEKIAEFLNVDINDLNKEQRIILVSLDFHSDVISAVLWLRDFGINIECLRIKPYVDEKGEIFVHPDKIIPIPEAKDYIQKKENKVRETKRINSFQGTGNLIESVIVELSSGSYRIERYDSLTVLVIECDSNQTVIARPFLRKIVEELGLQVNLLLNSGNEKNTRNLGKDVISELLKTGKCKNVLSHDIS